MSMGDKVIDYCCLAFVVLMTIVVAAVALWHGGQVLL